MFFEGCGNPFCSKFKDNRFLGKKLKISAVYIGGSQEKHLKF